MTPRERCLATLRFETADRIPLDPGCGRQSTQARWRQEGLPREVEPAAIPEYAYRRAGGHLPWPRGCEYPAPDVRLKPLFEEKVLERRRDSQIVQDWKGNICEIGTEYDVTYLREAKDFVTRRWLRCPVANRADWAAMRERYDAADPARFVPDAVPGVDSDREDYVSWSVPGPFWQLREWLGFEPLCRMLIDDPEFVLEMAEFWSDFVARVLERAFAGFVPDEVHVSEDMAYKRFAMISPEMTRTFLLPVYARWSALLSARGVPVYAVDSDGFVGELIPIWIEAGFSVCDPMEVAAENDIVRFRQQFGHSMAFRGGVDKRAMAKGGTTLATELKRVTPVIRDGGYIPGCDHGVPADVSWSNFVDYTRGLAELTGWL